MISIEALTKERLSDAINLTKEVFGESTAKKDLPASLTPDKYKKYLEKTEIFNLEYWVAVDGNDILGVIGLYSEENGKEETRWIGWFCVNPLARKRGIGSQLLRFVIEKARMEGRKTLKVYTSDHPTEINSHRLYEKHGFQLFKKRPVGNTGYMFLYYQLEL